MEQNTLVVFKPGDLVKEKNGLIGIVLDKFGLREKYEICWFEYDSSFCWFDGPELLNKKDIERLTDEELVLFLLCDKKREEYERCKRYYNL